MSGSDDVRVGDVRAAGRERMRQYDDVSAAAFAMARRASLSGYPDWVLERAIADLREEGVLPKLDQPDDGSGEGSGEGA